jgi:hypothetical protein
MELGSTPGFANPLKLLQRFALKLHWRIEPLVNKGVLSMDFINIEGTTVEWICLFC